MENWFTPRLLCFTHAHSKITFEFCKWFVFSDKATKRNHLRPICFWLMIWVNEQLNFIKTSSPVLSFFKSSIVLHPPVEKGSFLFIMSYIKMYQIVQTNKQPSPQGHCNWRFLIVSILVFSIFFFVISCSPNVKPKFPALVWPCVHCHLK